MFKATEQPQSVARTENWAVVIACILLAKAAVAPFSISPFLIGQYIDQLGLSVQHASQALSYEIFALAISNILAVFWINRIPPRSVAQRLLVILFLLNLSCMFQFQYSFFLLQRVFIGFTEGALLAIGFGCLSRTVKPNRNFGLYFAISLSVGAINLKLIPLFIGVLGVNGLFLNLSLYAVIALLGSSFLNNHSSTAKPSDAANSQNQLSKMGFSWLIAIICLVLANYVYFIGQGGVWSFLERLGMQRQFSINEISNILSLSLIAGVLGGISASVLDLKLGRIFPLLMSIVLAIVSMVMLLESSSVTAFLLAVCLFNYSNNMGHSYALGFAASLDKSSRLTVLSGALNTAGQASGPLLAGLVITNNYDHILWLGLISFSLTIMLLIPALVTVQHYSNKQ